ncbi:group II intron reverse transcriptase/maturase [Saccharicrinis carchari]|uniref:RNA-directed DNA polymerase n=1 Tax=Saccharicrinis carchari TaxID=1168039 RepID=A0A521EHJ3_SACCC|nr:group II intron reverse transcriptase/maturase [Saccharicrinis carchari]SMO83365.1 group II intron reverse transcriptase/maturase [Saccharicrinis carchari]
MEHQQQIAYQRDMFIEHTQEAIGQSGNRKDVNGAKTRLTEQLDKETSQGRVFAEGLIGIVCSSENINRAYKQVKKNKGVAGVDNVPVGNFAEWFAKEGDELVNQILRGEYLPSVVKLVEIPKPNGGVRQLGIPTVQDRILQQAISQVLTPIYEQVFSDHSYGFRPKRSAKHAIERASSYVKDGRNIVVDMDMKSFFDEVNHDRLMYRLSQLIQDKPLLKLIRKYLQSGVMTGGLVHQRLKGTPQGSPLSPLLSNIVLDELDKELEKRGHYFVRYADDFSIFVRSQRAGERVKESVCSYLTGKLKLKVNEQKSQVCKSSETKFLGFTILDPGIITISVQSVSRFKKKVRELTKRNRGIALEQVVSELEPILRGWLNYFRVAKCKRLLRNLDAWIRRKLRCYRLKQCKRTITLKRFLKSLGVPNWQSWILALSGRGWWRKSGCPQVHQAMNLKWFNDLGLFNLSIKYSLL